LYHVCNNVEEAKNVSKESEAGHGESRYGDATSSELTPKGVSVCRVKTSSAYELRWYRGIFRP